MREAAFRADLERVLGAAEGRPLFRPGTFEKPEGGEAALRLFESSRPVSAINLFKPVPRL